MIVRKLFVVLAILSGLFAFNGSLATTCPVDKPRTEIVVRMAEEKAVDQRDPVYQLTFRFFVQRISLEPQVLHPRLLTLLASSIYFKSAL